MSKATWVMPKKGSSLGRWRLHSVLGEGGNAVVWDAKHGVSGERAAVKVLKPPRNGEGGWERYSRFVVEVKTCRDVVGQHPHVLPVLDCDLPEIERITSPPWFAMPRAAPLSTHLGEEPTPEQVLDSLIPIAEALADLLDQHGLSHRDIKPENLYWWDGSPAIGDFGLVQLPEPTNITRENRDLGPRVTLPPEMRRGQPDRAGPPADVYELAMTAFLLLAGDAPPGGLRSDEPQHSLAILLDRPDLADLDAVLRAATRFNPANRPPMRQLATDLAAWRNPPGTPGLPDLERHKRRLASLAAESGAGSSADDGRAELVHRVESRVHERAKDTFTAIQQLSFDDNTVRGPSAWLNRIAAEGMAPRTGSHVSVQAPGSDGAVWFCGATLCGWQDPATVCATAAWLVAPYDGPPEVLWSRTEAVEPDSLADLHRAEQLVDEWAGQASLAIDRFEAEAVRFADATPQRWEFDDSEPPQLIDFSLVARADWEGHRRIDVLARIRAGRAGVAGLVHEGSPSQVRLVGPGGEVVDLMLNSFANRVSGTAFDGFYASSRSLQAFYPGGSWQVAYVLLADEAGHQRSLSATDLESAGFPAEVFLPPQDDL